MLAQRRLGRTGLMVSPIGFGGAVIGLQNYLSPSNRDDPAFRAGAAAAIAAALDEGVTLFDTAPGYGDGRSERIMGEALAGRREGVVLATKVRVAPEGGPDEWTRSVAASLERLRSDRVDLLQLHGSSWPDELADWVLAAGVPAWLDDMRRRGWCRHAGITAEATSGGLERLLRSGAFETLQVVYNILTMGMCDHYRAPFGIIPLARALGLGVIAIRAATSGILPKLMALELPGLDRQRLTRLALRWVLSTPEVDCTLIGMTEAGEVRANCALARDPGARIDIKAILDGYDGRPREGAPRRTT
jgi:aryl-alcohol dehydrogenase-like predicted oxidoreductase